MSNDSFDKGTDTENLNAAKSWDDATPDEIRDARIQSLEEGLEHLKQIVCEALIHARGPRDVARIIDEEWSR